MQRRKLKGKENNMIYPEGVKEELDRIVLQDPDKLSPEDLAYLRARAFYLDYNDVVKFAKVLKVSDLKVTPEEKVEPKKVVKKKVIKK
jgi:hypothetical protein